MLLVYVTVGYLFLSTVVSANEQPLPTGIFNNKDCVQCHEKIKVHKKNKSEVNCISCHGNEHAGAAEKARQDESCIQCHGGREEPVVHSYATSKHGLILKLENKEWDWSQPLANANYRTPGCAYCHMYAGEHNVSAAVRDEDLLRKNNEEIKSIQDVTRRVCQDCHAPRYITRLFDNGERMLEIGRKKVREAQHVIEQASANFSDEELIPARQQLEQMQVHLNNVYLGIAHQSPDYQWWHGHPALDGDLLRIKGMISELARIKKLNLLQIRK